MISTLWQASEIAAACEGTLQGANADTTSANVTGTVHIDSRKIQPGDLFIAIEGEVNDAHTYLDKVAEAQGSLALVHKPSAALPNVEVENTFEGLWDLAYASVERSPAKRIGITGSVGKTGTKELMRAAFEALGKTHATEGNLNNHFGLPLTLCRMPQDTDFAVLEMGMNHAGEIRDLVMVAKPQVCMITKIAPAHTEFFDSIDDIARAKAEIFESTSEYAVLNRDDPYYGFLSAIAIDQGLSVKSFGMHPEADARLVSTEARPKGGQGVKASIGGKDMEFDLALNGDHYGNAAVGVLMVASLLDQDLQRAAAGMNAVKPLPGRGEVTALANQRVLIDESYNASPVAMVAAFQVLRHMHAARQQGEPASGRSVAILGDMLELGAEGQDMHLELVEGLVSAEIDVLLGCGPLMQMACEKFAQTAKKPVQHFADAATLADEVHTFLEDGDCILVKGSLGSATAKICDALKAG